MAATRRGKANGIRLSVCRLAAKTANEDLRLEQFRGHSERLVKQDLYANCKLVALKRLFSQWRRAGRAWLAPQ